MPSIPNERALTAAPSRRVKSLPMSRPLQSSFRLATAVRLCVHALADRKAFTSQDLPSLCIALDLMRGTTRRRASSGDSELSAVAQRLHVPPSVGDRSRIRGVARDRLHLAAPVKLDG